MPGRGKWEGHGLSPFGTLNMPPTHGLGLKALWGAGAQMRLMEMGWEMQWCQGRLRLKDHR
eukprot:3434499-Karenia_brevis.AAC.1